jgi:acyl-CoA hydrolase
VYTLNGGSFFALGNLNGVNVAVISSVPDTRSVIAGQSLTFTATVTNTGGSGLTPTGTVTFRDLTYQDLTPITTTLASNVALDSNGQATVQTSSLTAGGPFLGNHFITATYSGDGNFSGGGATLIQKVHASASTTMVSSSPNPSTFGQPVTFTALLASAIPGATPSGMITFRDNSAFLKQLPLGNDGSASFNTSTQTQAATPLPPGIRRTQFSLRVAETQCRQSVQVQLRPRSR